MTFESHWSTQSTRPSAGRLPAVLSAARRCGQGARRDPLPVPGPPEPLGSAAGTRRRLRSRCYLCKGFLRVPAAGQGWPPRSSDRSRPGSQSEAARVPAPVRNPLSATSKASPGTRQAGAGSGLLWVVAGLTVLALTVVGFTLYRAPERSPRAKPVVQAGPDPNPPPVQRKELRPDDGKVETPRAKEPEKPPEHPDEREKVVRRVLAAINAQRNLEGRPDLSRH